MIRIAALLNEAIQQLSARDMLAVQRTVLGNTRTLLAVVRTALGLLAVGAGFLRFLEHTFFHIVGHMLIISSVLVLIFGVVYFFYFRRRIYKVIKHAIDHSSS